MTDVADPTWRRADSVAVVEREGRVVAVDLEHAGSAPVVLDGTGAVVWELLETTTTQAGLVTAVAETFAAEPTEVAAHVEEFLRQLLAVGLVEREGAS